MSSNTQEQPRQGYITKQRTTDKPKLNGDCHYCGKRRHRERECRSEERDQAQSETPQNEQREQTERL